MIGFRWETYEGKRFYLFIVSVTYPFDTYESGEWVFFLTVPKNCLEMVNWHIEALRQLSLDSVWPMDWEGNEIERYENREEPEFDDIWFNFFQLDDDYYNGTVSFAI